MVLIFGKMELTNTQIHLLINTAMSFAGFLCLMNIIPKFRDMFIAANLYGIDMSKPGRVKMSVSTQLLQCQAHVRSNDASILDRLELSIGDLAIFPTALV